MRIIIAGAGEVGFHIAKLLAYEGQDIILIDKDKEKLDYVASHLDVATIKGSSTSLRVLQEAMVEKADLVICATSTEETNIATAIIAKNLGAKKTVSRIENTEYLQKKDILNLKTIGIDEIISPESLAAKEIERLLKEAALTDTFDFSRGMLSMIGLSIHEDSVLNNKTIAEASSMHPGHDFVTAAILRDNETIIPRGNNRFQKDDHAYFIVCPDVVDKLISLTGNQSIQIKNVMILGGSKVGINAAKRLSKKYNVKLVERDKEKAFELADQLKETLVINGDGRNIELLEDEGIEEMDAFVAVTGNSETNIISSLVAKKHHVKKTISLVENIDYIQISQDIGVDTMINKKLIAANFIFRYVRKGQVLSLTSIHGVDAEVLEFEVQNNSKITKHELKDLNFPAAAVIGGVIRRGEGYVTLGNFQFKPKDRVVVLARPNCIRSVESFFN